MTKRIVKSNYGADTGDGLQRKLANRHLQLIAIGGTIGTSLFVGSAKVLTSTGPSALLIYALAGITFFFGMRILGELLLSNLKYKSFRDAVEDILGPAAGFIIGWMYLFFWIFTVAQDVVGIATYLQFWVDGFPVWLTGLIFIGLIMVVNLVAVNAFGELEFWFSIIKVIAIIVITLICLFFVISIFKFSDGNAPNLSNLWSNGFFEGGAGGFLKAFQISFLAYAGIELVGAAAAEAKDPEKNLPKAINSLPIRISLFYVVPILMLCVCIPTAMLHTGQSPFVQLFALSGIGFAAVIMNFVLLTAAASGANSGVYASSRMLFGLSIPGDAPKLFGKLSRFRVPLHGVIFSSVISLVLIVLLQLFPDTATAYDVISGIASSFFLFSWYLIIIAYIVYLKKTPELHQKSIFKAPGTRIAAFFVLIVLGFDNVLEFFDPNELVGAIVGIVLLGVTTAVYYYFHHGKTRLTIDETHKFYE